MMWHKCQFDWEDYACETSTILEVMANLILNWWIWKFNILTLQMLDFIKLINRYTYIIMMLLRSLIINARTLPL